VIAEYVTGSCGMGGGCRNISCFKLNGIDSIRGWWDRSYSKGSSFLFYRTGWGCGAVRMVVIPFAGGEGLEPKAVMLAMDARK
jgi:hypothetical protein